MRPNNSAHVIFFLAGLGCFALPFFHVSYKLPLGRVERIGSVDGYPFVIGGVPMFPDLSLPRDALEEDRRRVIRVTGLFTDATMNRGDWRGWLGAAGFGVGLMAVLARLPYGNAVAGLGGLMSLAGLALLAFVPRPAADAAIVTEIAYGLMAAPAFALMGVMTSWRRPPPGND